MRDTLQKLLELQQLHFADEECSPATISQLRRSIPADLLARFDRLVKRGRRPVAMVYDGVCSECHIRLATGVAFALKQRNQFWTCDSCGRFLYFTETTARHSQTPIVAESLAKAA